MPPLPLQTGMPRPQWRRGRRKRSSSRRCQVLSDPRRKSRYDSGQDLEEHVSITWPLTPPVQTIRPCVYTSFVITLAPFVVYGRWCLVNSGLTVTPFVYKAKTNTEHTSFRDLMCSSASVKIIVRLLILAHVPPQLFRPRRTCEYYMTTSTKN